MEWLLLSWPTLILLGLGLRMALRLTYGVRGADAGDPVYEFLRITGWVLIVLGLAPASLGGLYSVVGGIVVVLAAATFIEINLQLPATTTLAVRVSSLFVEFLAVPVILTLVVLLLGSGIVGICYLCDFAVLRPFSDRWFRGRRLADILRILAVATEERQPLAD